MHFRESDFRDSVKKQLLKPGAVPSMFSEPTSCAGQTEARKKKKDLRFRKSKREPSLTCTKERSATGSEHCGDINVGANEHGSFELVPQLTDSAHNHDKMTNATRSVEYTFTSNASNQAAEVVSAAAFFSTKSYPTFGVGGHEFEGDTNVCLDNEPECCKFADDPKTDKSDNETLANSVFCFLLCGLHARFKIPVGYFFTKGCTGEQLAEVFRHVIH